MDGEDSFLQEGVMILGAFWNSLSGGKWRVGWMVRDQSQGNNLNEIDQGLHKGRDIRNKKWQKA